MEKIVEINRKKLFSLIQVKSILPVIYRVTDKANREVHDLINRLEAFKHHNQEAASCLENEINAIITKWQKKIEKLGGNPKGLWLADFDNGNGYFCWKFPENDINYYHGYEEGFSGRKPVKEYASSDISN